MLGLGGGGAGAGINASAFAGGVGDTGLGGHAARMGFAQAGNTHHQQHQHQQSHSSMGDHPVRVTTNKGRIRDVWKHNLYDEFATIRAVTEQGYNYIAMVIDPGVLARRGSNYTPLSINKFADWFGFSRLVFVGYRISWYSG